jgi:hypothetical protein
MTGMACSLLDVPLRMISTRAVREERHDARSARSAKSAKRRIGVTLDYGDWRLDTFRGVSR